MSHAALPIFPDPSERTLFVVHLAATFGGAERTTLNLLAGLDRSVFTRVALLAPRTMHDCWRDVADVLIDAEPLAMAGWFDTPVRLARDVEHLAPVIRDMRADVVIGMMHYMAVVAELAVRKYKLDARVIGSFRGPVFEHLNAYEPSRWRRWWISWQLRRAARGMFCIIVPGIGTRDELLRHRVGVASQMRVVPNGIDPLLFAHLAEGPLELPAGVKPGRFVLALGRLSVEKHFDDILTAYASSGVPWPLVIVGEGPELEPLTRQATDLGIAAHVHFAGVTQTPERWMRRAGVFVHTCQYEGFGYVLLEAAALGTPVIATDCPFGPREVLGRAGLLVGLGNQTELAAAMRQLVHDAALRERLSLAGRSRALDFPLRKNQVELAALLQAALEQPSVKPCRARHADFDAG